MKLIRHSLLVALCVASQADATITLSNVSAAQREGTKTVDVTFDASNTEAPSVSVTLIVSNGMDEVSQSTWMRPTGSGLTIPWLGEAYLNQTLTSNLSFTVMASEAGGSGMRLVPGGTISGTNPDPELGGYSLSVSSFLMDKYETTKAMWDTHADFLFGITTTDALGLAPDHPAYSVTWYEAVRWCNARSSHEGLAPCYNLNTWSCDFSANGYRLPTVEEWEYAARGGLESQRYPWGNSIDHTNVNCKVNGWFHPDTGSGFPKTLPVGSFPANGYGLYDMAGNIYEWCWDAQGLDRNLRGGSWIHGEDQARCGHRVWDSPGTFNYSVGFRTVRNAQTDTATVAAVYDSRDYRFEVLSEHGSPVPAVGTHLHPWKSSVQCSVESEVLVDGTNYTCAGWSGTGSVPVAGTTNAVAVVLSNLSSSITWNWVTDDSDSDGMADDWERAFFGDLSHAATNDFDHDGQDNYSEYIAGTIPTNPASRFELVPGVAGIDRIKLEWTHATGRTYNVYWTPNLQHTPFTNLESNLAYPRNSVTVTPTQAQGYFKADVSK